jgi:hypoxanthine phosphoribosyltransferase
MKRLLSREEIASGINRLAAEVQRDCGGKPLTVIGVLTGSIVLVADLLRRLEGPIEVGMVWASSYRGAATRPGRLDLRLDLLPDLTGRNVLLVDDIFDTGRTLEALVASLHEHGAASVRTLVLLRKPDRVEVDMNPDYVGFDIPDAFVVGYGLDHDGAWRNLPEICILDPTDADGSAGRPSAAQATDSIKSLPISPANAQPR